MKGTILERQGKLEAAIAFYDEVERRFGMLEPGNENSSIRYYVTTSAKARAALKARQADQ
jgi:hypothetical protein